MAILSANIGLAASFLDQSKVSKENFIKLLHEVDSPNIKEVIYSRPSGLSSLVVFFEDEISNYESREYPDDAFEIAIRTELLNITEWLSKQTVDSFKSFEASGLKVWMFFEFWIENVQLDISLPPNLLAECGRLNITIDIVTND